MSDEHPVSFDILAAHRAGWSPSQIEEAVAAVALINQRVAYVVSTRDPRCCTFCGRVAPTREARRAEKLRGSACSTCMGSPAMSDMLDPDR